MDSWQQLSRHLAEYTPQYLVAASALSLLSTAAVIWVLLRMRAVVKPFSKVRAQTDDTSKLLQAVLQTAEQAETGIVRLDQKLDRHLEESRSFIGHLGLVRYDAFEDVAGLQSFSMCLLNADRDGVLITYLAGKNSTRSYAVAIEAGKASRELSDEETRAVDGALSSEPVLQT